MTASLWLVAGLACAQIGPADEQTPAMAPPRAEAQIERVPPPRPATSKVDSVTVFQGQALVTREVKVPEGRGTTELVVTPLPTQTVDSSLFTEGADGLRVLSTRYRGRAVKDDTRREVRAREDLIQKLQADSQRIQRDLDAHGEDLRYLQKLEGFTSASLSGLTKEGRLDSAGILALSKFIMESRGSRSKNEVELRQRLQANTEAVEFAKRELAELAAGSSRTERDAVIVIQKTRPMAGTVRLGYLVTSATWTPQYRLRGFADNAPVKLEYLAAVVQQTGEDWSDVRITLSTARPSLDAAPPELLPLNMAVADATDGGPLEAKDDRSRKIATELSNVVDLSFPTETSLQDVIKRVRSRTKSQTYPEGIPIYVDPIGLSEADKSMTSSITFDVKDIPLRTSLGLMLKQLGLGYRIKDGLLTITSQESLDGDLREDERDSRGLAEGMGGMGAGMGGMGGMGGGGLSLELASSYRGASLNRAAARDQADELRVAGDQNPVAALAEKDTPSVTFPIAGRLDVPSRHDPQLFEVSRVELCSDYFAKAVPVLTPRVYRLARLTNQSDLVLLPGEATVYSGGDFVGRMTMPLVAAGEPFIAGFGVDPQVQISRRLVHKTRSVQGGNQVFDYEFRIGLRNYRTTPVKVQLWDRLPRPHGETVAVNLVKTSVELSADTAYQRTSRTDNLLRWDLTLPPATVGEKTIYLNYEFRLEYARDLPQPRFVSGGLREGPIGGGAIAGGMGGMGGMRSVSPTHQ